MPGVGIGIVVVMVSGVVMVRVVVAGVVVSGISGIAGVTRSVVPGVVVRLVVVGAGGPGGAASHARKLAIGRRASGANCILLQPI